MNQRQVFIAALQRESAAQRRAYLDAVCGSDEELRRDVEALLAVHERAGSFLEHPFADPAVTIDDPIRERPGTAIGPYKLMEQIGEGGMGLVFGKKKVPGSVFVSLLGLSGIQQDSRS